MNKIAGGCLCGQVRYQTDAAPAVTALCHCKHCQKQAGSAFSVIVGVPKGSLKITGELSVYRDIGESGQPVFRKFCGRCGSPILSDVTVAPQLDFIKAGTLDDASWLQPQVQFFCDSAQPWTVTALNSAAKLPRNPSD